MSGSNDTIEFTVVRQAAIDHLASAKHDTVRLRTRKEFTPAPGAEKNEIGGAADGNAAHLGTTCY
jgi:hypothetical protein